MKARNLIINCDTMDEVNRIAADYRAIGSDFDIDPDKLTITVLALPHDYKRKRDRDNKLVAKREAVEEAYEQRYQ